MKSPRFDNRAQKLREIFKPENLEVIWKTKVRHSMRDQFINDGVENLDFHSAYKLECKKLSQLIVDGDYIPQKPMRILVEKSKGLCRQLVIPNIKDALVLQCLTDALYAEISDRAPTKQSFFELKDHSFSTTRFGYGTFASWLNFQREIFKFSKNRAFIIVTDVANYYDSISYSHLRNVISSITRAEECVLDMLIFILSDLLWQPDYTPRIEVGIPQMDLDAPRLLAHCFLYEADQFLASDPNRDFARYMDDIDIGVDSVVTAKNVLKSLDLVLQTKQIRLNSGKTQILHREEAYRHFRVFENARLDLFRDRIDRRIKGGLPLNWDRRYLSRVIPRGLKKGAFDTGNGEKILKRLLSLAKNVNALVPHNDIEKIVRLRPGVRDGVFNYMRSQPLSPNRLRTIKSCVFSGMMIDDASHVELCNHLVETIVLHKAKLQPLFNEIIDHYDANEFYGFYQKVWLQSKYQNVKDLLNTFETYKDTWIAHERLGRIVGAMRPLFFEKVDLEHFTDLVSQSRNFGAAQTYRFQGAISLDKTTYERTYPFIRATNESRGTRITHSKFLCLLSALRNKVVSTKQKDSLLLAHQRAFEDRYYRPLILLAANH
jgi:hypothetical protein